MRYALISDIHANLPALRSVLDDITTRNVDATYHLGDLTGYAPWPNETVALLRQRGIQGIAGNYDSTIATGYKHCGCKSENPHQEELSHQSYSWTRSHVSDETKRYLASLPFRMDIRPLGGHASGPTLTLVHGSQVLNTVYVTADRPDSFLEKMAEDVGATAASVICFGHTHIPWHRVVGGIHFVNTGSVGRPKDGDWRAGYALLSLDGSHTDVEFVRVSYDLDEAASGIRASDLPEELARQLQGAP
ncbi:MAG: metallophosphatase family protein [Gemmatimonadota bacterium]|nr:metallophosphatase family protein [Gemmatimonadota bacterium]